MCPRTDLGLTTRWPFPSCAWIQAGQNGTYPKLAVLLAEKPDKRPFVMQHMRDALLALMNKVRCRSRAASSKPAR